MESTSSGSTLLTLSRSKGEAKSFRDRAVSSTALQYTTALISTLLNALTSVLVLRAVSVETYGSYNILASIVAFGNMASSLGLVPIIQRSLPEYVTKKQGRLAKHLVLASVALRLAASLVFAALLILTQNSWMSWLNLPDTFRTGHMLAVLVAAITIASVNAQLLGDGILVSLFQHTYWGVVRVGYGLVKLTLFVWALGSGTGIEGLLTAWLASELLMILPYATRVAKTLAGLPSQAPERLPWRRIAAYGGSLYLNNISYFMRDKSLDVFFVAYFLSSYDVGFYAMAFGMAMLLLQFTPVLQLRGIMTTLMVERAVADRSRETLQRFFSFYAKLVLFLGMPLFVLPAAFSHEVIHYLLNPMYEPAAGLFAVSLGIVSFAQLPYIYHPALATTEQSRILFWGNLAALANIALDLLLIPKWGLWGVVAASGVGHLLLYSYYAIVVRRSCGLVQPWGAYARIAALLAITFTASYVFLRPLVSSPWSLIAAGCAAAGGYLLLARVWRIFSHEERALVNQLLGRQLWVW